MKKALFFLVCSIMSVAYTSASHETYMQTLQRVTTIVQNISQDLIADMSKNSTRSSNAFSPDSYCSKMAEAIQKEMDAIIGDKNPNQLSTEDKEVIKMLETYIEQLNAYSKYAIS